MSEQSLRGELKLYLIDYFDGVQFEIDIKAQKLLENLKDESQMREDVLNMNLVMLNKVKEIYENNSKAIDDYFNSKIQVDTDNLEELKATIFKGFCVFYDIEYDYNNWYYEDELLLGMLIVTDFYLDRNQRNYLRCLFSYYFEYI